ncbi:hypothetical protein HFO38_30545 [Rhizobium leguminosarum]|uniref:hypothetical protein n=1 Tax=Rhizobium leguminosarum TaxID=384 RepID=UPI001C966F3A|nr:hypothetical protein [Rhizobium leguminosarum]MBY5706989.1 hypothetical protein [Rhizobium leguminosarum]
MEVGEILIALNTAFEQFSRKVLRARDNVRLRIRDLRRGSLDIVLDVVDSVGKIIKAAEALAPFASHLMEIVGILCGQHSGKVTKADRKAVEAIANPVANGNASQINLIVNGQAHFTFNVESATALRAAQTSSLVVTPRAAEAEGPHRYMSTHQVRSLSSEGLYGTALNVDNDWYARLEGGQGVLVPISVTSDIAAALHHKAVYIFKGTIRKGALGEQIGIDVMNLTRIGS